MIGTHWSHTRYHIDIFTISQFYIPRILSHYSFENNVLFSFGSILTRKTRKNYIYNISKFVTYYIGRMYIGMKYMWLKIWLISSSFFWEISVTIIIAESAGPVSSRTRGGISKHDLAMLLNKRLNALMPGRARRHFQSI